MARPSFLILLLIIIAIAAAPPGNAAAAQGGGRDHYDPAKVDWASVVDACAAACRFERRLCSFFLRSAFHDAGSLTPKCATAGARAGAGCGGADGSLLVSEAEQLHPNNRNELFAANSAKAVLPIAKKFNAGIADTLYVCGLVAPAVLRSGSPSPKEVRSDPVLLAALRAKFRVGRVDRPGGGTGAGAGAGNNPGLLPSEKLDLNDFAAWFNSRGVDLEDAAALLGVHTLLRPKGCYVDGEIDAASGLPQGCNPFASSAAAQGGEGQQQTPPLPGDAGPFKPKPRSCPMVSMLKWSNGWFNDMCGVEGQGGFKITREALPDAPLRPGDEGFAKQVADAVCGYRSRAFREDAIARQMTGSFVTPPSGPAPTVIEWECPATGCRSNPRTFFFTQNDAHLGDACRAGALLPAPVAAAAAAPGARAAAAALSAAAAAAAPGARAAAAPGPADKDGGAVAATTPADAADAADVAAAAARVQALMQSATLAATEDRDVGFVKEIHDNFMEYAGGRAGLAQWDTDFARAYSRMSELGAQWVAGAFSPANLAEYCPSGWVHARGTSRALNAMCARRCGQQPGASPDCPDACRCSTAARSRVAAVEPATGPFVAAA